MPRNKPVVLFQTEGSYPFEGGGISTWANILCSELIDHVDFVILSFTGQPHVESKYEFSTNIRSIIHVPLWGVEEPVSFFDDRTPFSEQVKRKYRTDPKIVEKLFLPMFRDFIHHIFDPFQPARQNGELVYGFWKYFQHFDYKQTLSCPLVWTEFKNLMQLKLDEQDDFLSGYNASMLDMTFGKRWLYHFMMPLALSLPTTTVTHSTLAGFPAITSIAAKFEYGTPMILTDHGVFIRERLINVSRAELPFFSKRLLVNLATFITRAVYYFADLIAPVTSVNAKWEMRFEADEDRIQPIYNGVDVDTFYPQPKPNSTVDIPTVVAVAHLFPLKDIETMIRSCDLVRREIPAVQYRLYGSLEVDKLYTAKCKKLVRALNLEDHFIFGGYHTNPSMIFTEGDISILSSISEGFPYTVIESMSCGRPVVATDVGGIREAVKDCGILCKPHDYKNLAKGVVTLLKDEDLRKEYAEKGRQRVLNHYTISESVDSYRKVYEHFHNQKQIPLSDDIQLRSVNNTLKKL